jgi:serine/threonine-protein kinase
MELQQRFLGAGKLLLLAGGFLTTYLLFAAAGMQIALKTREVQVPDLSGRTPEEATTAVAELGLTLRIEPLRRIHPSIPAGRVSQQEPDVGLTTRRRRSVKVWISSGSTAGSVPALVGESETGARRRLAEDALEVLAISEIRSSRYPTNSVVGQEPPPSGQGPAVSLLINRGERGATYVMPDLIGVTGSTAAEILRTRGFRVTVVGEHPYPGVPSGVVLRQYPPAGFQTAHGEPISLEVSR